MLQGAVTLLLSRRLLPTEGAVDYGDTALLRNVRAAPTDVLGALSPNYLGQDQSATWFIYAPRGALTWLLSAMGVPFAAISYLLSFGLLLACACVVVVLVERISGSALVALAAGAYVQLNGFTIDAIAFGSFSYIFPGSVAIGLLLWRLYSRREHPWRVRDSLAVGLISLLVVHPTFLAMYLLVLFLYFVPRVFRAGGRAAATHVVAASGLAVALASYWLLPLALSAISRGPEGTYQATSLESVYRGFIDAARPGTAIQLIGYPHSPAKALYDGALSTLVPFAIFALVVLAATRIRPFRHAGWLLAVLLLFTSLGLGPDALLTGHAWEAAWERLSLLHFFRSFTRFWAPVPLLLVALLALGARHVPRRAAQGLAVALLAVLVLSSLPVLDGEVGGSVRASQLPASYELAQEVIAADPRQVSIVSYPNTAYEIYTWSLNSDLSTAVQASFIQDYLFTKPVILDRASLNLASSAGGAVGSAFASPTSDHTVNDLRSLNVGWVIVHKDLLDAKGQPVPAGPSLEYWEARGTPVLVTREFSLFRLENPDTLVRANGRALVAYPNPSRVDMELVTSGREFLRLNRSFDPRWKLFALPWNEEPPCHPRPAISDDVATVSECPPARSFEFTRNTLMRGARVLDVAAHAEAAGWANGWTFNARDVQNTLPREYAKPLAGGGIQLRLVMLYEPQRTLNAGLAISGISLLVVLACLFATRSRSLAAVGPLGGSEASAAQAVAGRPDPSPSWRRAWAQNLLGRGLPLLLPLMLLQQDRGSSSWINAALVTIAVFAAPPTRVLLWLSAAQVVLAGGFEVAERPASADLTLNSAICLLLIAVVQAAVGLADVGRASTDRHEGREAAAPEARAQDLFNGDMPADTSPAATASEVGWPGAEVARSLTGRPSAGLGWPGGPQPWLDVLTKEEVVREGRA